MSRARTWFQPGDGIAREVITADIQRYLGPDATVRPGSENGMDGFYIKAYRTLTSEMVQDLKQDSQRWRRETQQSRERGSPFAPSSPLEDGDCPDKPTVRYQDSQTHQSRQHHGPSTPAPSAVPPLDQHSSHRHQPGHMPAGYSNNHNGVGRTGSGAPLPTQSSPVNAATEAMYRRLPPSTGVPNYGVPNPHPYEGAQPQQPPQPDYGQQPGYYAPAPGQPPYGYPQPRTTPTTASPYGPPETVAPEMDPRYQQDPRAYGYPAHAPTPPSGHETQYSPSTSANYIDPYGRAYATAPPSRDSGRTQAPPSANDRRRRY